MINRLEHFYYNDKELSDAVRHAIDAEKFILVASKNIQVIVENGTVTLKGEVLIEQEKLLVGIKAAYYAGLDKVINDLAIAEEME